MQSCLLIEEANNSYLRKWYHKITLGTTNAASKQTTLPFSLNYHNIAYLFHIEVISNKTFPIEGITGMTFHGQEGMRVIQWPSVQNLTPHPKTCFKTGHLRQRFFPNSKPKTCFPHLPVTKAACFGLDYSQIPQSWVFAVTALLVPVNFNGQSTIIKMFHEVFRNIHRNLLRGTNQLVTVTTRPRLWGFTALTLIKAFIKTHPPPLPKTQSRGKEVLLQFVKSGGRSKLCDFPKIKVYKELKNDHRLLQALSQRLRKKIKAKCCNVQNQKIRTHQKVLHLFHKWWEE